MDYNQLIADSKIEASDSELASISELVDIATRRQEEIDSMKSSLKALEKEQRELLTRDLPEAMDAAGVETFKTKGGKEVSVKDFVSASIPKANQEEAFTWLREHGHGELIKNTLTTDLPRGSDNEAGHLAVYMQEQFGLSVERKEAVHPQTLSAWCREQMEKGQELPEQLLGLYAGRVAKIK